jgi:hypothetical protein
MLTRVELSEATGLSAHNLEGLLSAGEELRRRLEFDFLAVTLCLPLHQHVDPLAKKTHNPFGT